MTPRWRVFVNKKAKMSKIVNEEVEEKKKICR